MSMLAVSEEQRYCVVKYVPNRLMNGDVGGPRHLWSWGAGGAGSPKVAQGLRPAASRARALEMPHRM
eukprot:scaffold115260_cov61-Phaeocystis_antarctica.AAC.2